MKEIKELEALGKKETSEISPIFAEAYFESRKEKNELINFSRGFCDYEFGEILRDCRRFGIAEFTISTTLGGFILQILAEFQERGCKLEGMIEIKCQGYIIPAIKLSL